MKRYAHLRRLAPLGGLAAAVVVALSAGPAGATVVCQPGHTAPSPYCTNFTPIGTTSPETNITSTSAQFNGQAGSRVAGGDPTTFYWQWGTTTSYGNLTTFHTLGSCTPGHSAPSPYCNTPASQPVSFLQQGLVPCTTYHDRLVAANRDGTTFGSDSRFQTAFQKPISNVKAKKKVRRNHRFRVSFRATTGATFKILIKNQRGHIVRSANLGFRRAGQVNKKIKAPGRAGHYRLIVFSKLSCGQQRVKRNLRVRR
jgi:hypothetical protein